MTTYIRITRVDNNKAAMTRCFVSSVDRTAESCDACGGPIYAVSVTVRDVGGAKAFVEPSCLKADCGSSQFEGVRPPDRREALQ